MENSITETSKKALNDFDMDAQHWGRQREYGYGNEPEESKEEYEATKAKLVKRILHLENKIRKLKEKRKEPATANDFFRVYTFAVTWNEDRMNTKLISPNKCIQLMQKYKTHIEECK